MGTIESYEKMSSDSLRKKLLLLENILSQKNVGNDDEIDNYIIDIHLIRMELNKRLWKTIEK